MQIENGSLVAIDYILTNDDGETLDTSKGNEPLQYQHGEGQIIPGLEQALAGKKSGDKLSVSIPPEDAYGEKDPALQQTVSAEMFQGVDKVEVGMKFQAETATGVQLVEVVGTQDDEVTIDLNHPLAGQTLHFDVEVVLVQNG